ncbi:MAG: rhomboid family intramembrane serine protease [Planctomycetota bacterium]
MSLGMPSGTKGLLIAMLAAYIIVVFTTNQTDITSSEAAALFSGNAGANGSFALNTFILQPGNIFPFHAGTDIKPWKLFTSWIVPPTLIGAIMSLLMTYFAGKMLEDIFGTKRYLTLFIGGAIGANLLACLIDPYLVGSRSSIVMGPTGGVFAAFTTIIWIAPEQRSAFGIRMKSMMIALIVIFGGMALMAGLTGEGEPANSPTQLLFGAAIGSLFMIFLKSGNQVPKFAKAAAVDKTEANAGMRKFAEAARQQEEEFAKEKADKDRTKQSKQKDATEMDRILGKISDNGIDSLSRKEKKFLDSQSKSK